ncbi:MAG: RidA family protein [Chitinophagaceae bacterium]|nr:RidA family protein [Flavisolibacter longurius]RYZ61913.1 MAG: RidA family protein [Chitinophagaceae bacterium]
MKPVLFVFALLFSFSVSAQNNTITKKKFHWGTESDTTAGYTQAVLSGSVLYISGTVGMGKTMEEQFRSVYGGIDRTLKHFGLTVANIVKENLYTTDIEAAKNANSVRKLFYKGDYPAATWVQISRLYMQEALVEVEIIAHLPPLKGE